MKKKFFSKALSEQILDDLWSLDYISLKSILDKDNINNSLFTKERVLYPNVLILLVDIFNNNQYKIKKSIKEQNIELKKKAVNVLDLILSFDIHLERDKYMSPIVDAIKEYDSNMKHQGLKFEDLYNINIKNSYQQDNVLHYILKESFNPEIFSLKILNKMSDSQRSLLKKDELTSILINGSLFNGNKHFKKDMFKLFDLLDANKLIDLDLLKQESLLDKNIDKILTNYFNYKKEASELEPDAINKDVKKKKNFSFFKN